jgi:hypothetical protein
MTKYVIGPDVAIRLAQDEVAVDKDHQILAPTLIRSQLLHGSSTRWAAVS